MDEAQRKAESYKARNEVVNGINVRLRQRVADLERELEDAREALRVARRELAEARRVRPDGRHST